MKTESLFILVCLYSLNILDFMLRPKSYDFLILHQAYDESLSLPLCFDVMKNWSVTDKRTNRRTARHEVWSSYLDFVHLRYMHSCSTASGTFLTLINEFQSNKNKYTLRLQKPWCALDVFRQNLMCVISLCLKLFWKKYKTYEIIKSYHLITSHST